MKLILLVAVFLSIGLTSNSMAADSFSQAIAVNHAVEASEQQSEENKETDFDIFSKGVLLPSCDGIEGTPCTPGAGPGPRCMLQPGEPTMCICNASTSTWQCLF